MSLHTTHHVILSSLSTAEFCLGHLLFTRHPTMFYQHFVECVFHFNDYENHRGTEIFKFLLGKVVCVCVCVCVCVTECTCSLCTVPCCCNTFFPMYLWLQCTTGFVKRNARKLCSTSRVREMQQRGWRSMSSS